MARTDFRLHSDSATGTESRPSACARSRAEARRLVAARDFQYDRKLGHHNTTPDPLDVKKLVDLERNPRGAGGGQPVAPEGDK